MAIEPFQRRIPVPGGAGITQQGVGRVADVGEAISGLAGTAMQIMEPRLKKQAIEQGTVDAARQVIGKDEAGNYVMPDTPEGGDIYAAAFDQAKREQYKLLVMNDAELEMNRIYSDPANIGKPPEEMRYLAENYLQGIMGAVDPFVENEIYEGVTREIRQRDLAANNAWLRQEAALMERGFTTKMAKAEGDALEAYANGGEVEGDRLKVEGRAALEQLVKLRMRAPEELDAWDGKFVSVRAGGEFLQQVRGDLGEGTLFASDLDRLVRMLDGTSNETVIVGGKEVTGDTLRAMISDPEVRTNLMAKFNRRSRELAEEEAKQLEKDGAISLMAAVPLGGNKPYGASDDKWAAAWEAWSGQEGVNLLSPDGVTTAYHRSPDLPEKIYKTHFANLSSKTSAELEALRPLYQTMQNMLPRGGDGTRVAIASKYIAKEEEPILYHYTQARSMGVTPQDALARARAAQERGLGKPSDELRAMLRARGDYKNNEELFDKLDDDVGVKWQSLNQRAQEAIELDVAQQVAMGVDIDTARKSAGTRFQASWTKQLFTLDSALSRRRGLGNSWSEKDVAVPKVMNPSNARETNDAWVTNYVQAAIQEWGGQQLPGVPGAKDLMFGTNVWLQPTGRKSEAGGTQFALMYYDPSKSSPPTMLFDKGGMPIQMEFDRAAKRQQLHLEAEFNRLSGRAWRAPAAATKKDYRPLVYTPGGVPYTGTLSTPSAEAIRMKYAPVNLNDVAPPSAQRDVSSLSANNWPGVARYLAGRYGLPASEVAMIMSYETGGKFDPDIWGGKNNNYFGLIQFGPEERQKHLMPLLGKRKLEDATPMDWAKAIGSFLDERGFKRGMSGLDLYSTINAGRPGRYKASDNGGKDTVRTHYQRMRRDHHGNGQRWLATG